MRMGCWRMWNRRVIWKTCGWNVGRFEKKKQQVCRWMRQCEYHELSYASTGDPCKVLQYYENDEMENDMLWNKIRDKNDVSLNVVGVKLHYAPLNPADINAVQGVYPSPYTSTSMRQSNSSFRPFQASMKKDDDDDGDCWRVGGSEGIGIVTHTSGTGSSSTSEGLQVGDVVSLAMPSMGTWRSFHVLPESFLVKWPTTTTTTNNNIRGEDLAPLPQIGGTAYRMLHDFVHLQEGDVILQNGGASSVGILVSQLASLLFGVKVISIVQRGTTRTDQQWNDLVHYLKTVGKATHVLQQEVLLHPDTSQQAMHDLLQLLKTENNSNNHHTLPKLALNCIGGPSATLLARCLSHNGTMITYGGMSKQNISLSTGSLIFKNIHYVGYWHSAWNVQHHHNSGQNEKQTMMDQLIHLACHEKSLHCPPTLSLPLTQYADAFQYAIHGQNQTNHKHPYNFLRPKVVFKCQE